MLDQFLGDILPATGFYALWDKTTKQHQWFDSQEALFNRVSDHVAHEDQGVYFATAAFNEQAAINGNKDARTQANVLAKKCFYLDLDAGAKKLEKHGEEKVYTDQRAAITAAAAFIKQTGLAPTYFVSSGEGLHLYWALEDEIEPYLWTPIAKRMSKLFRQYGLKEDPAVTSDSARILRPLGTVHENGSKVKALMSRGKVWSFDELSGLAANLLVDAPEEFELPQRKPEASSINKDLVVEGPPKSIRKIYAECEAVRNAISKRGDVEEPYWRAMLGIVKHTVEGDSLAHKASSGHPSYDRDETQRKLDNWKTGPTTCVEFAKHCSSMCNACPHKGQIKSPIVLGLMSTVEVKQLPPEKQPAAMKAPEPTGMPWDGLIPPGFTVEGDDGNYTLVWNMPVEMDNEHGEKVTIYVKVPFTQDIFWFGSWSDAEHTEDSAKVFVHKWGRFGSNHYVMDQELLSSIYDLRKFLADKAIHLTTHKHAIKALMEYTTMQMTAVKALRDMPKVSRRFGLFITPDGRINAAHGAHVITHTGEIYKAIMSADLRNSAPALAISLPETDAMRYDNSVWDDELLPKARRYVEFMKKYYGNPRLAKFQLAAMMGLASPLMPFVTGEYVGGPELPPNGLAVSLFSKDSGKGKSYMMKAVALAYGRPASLNGDGNADNATNVYRLTKLGMMGSYPVMFDEMGRTPASELAGLVSSIANGMSRSVGKKEGGIKEGVKFALVALMATNKSARELVQEAQSESNAIQMRLFELNVDDIEEFDADLKTQYDADWTAVQDTCGALGALIERSICKFSVQDVNKLVSTMVGRARDVTEGSQSERFQYRGLGAVLALQAILKHLGLEIFDRDLMVEEFRQANALGLAFAQENVLPSDGNHLLTMALHDLTPFTAVTNTETRRSRYVTAFDEPLVPMPHVVHARHIVTQRCTYVSTEALREWCQKRKVSFSKLILDAKNAGVFDQFYAGRPTSAGYNLLKGMRGSTESMITCYKVNVFKLAQVTGYTVDYEGVPTDNVVHLNPPQPPEPPTTTPPEGEAVNQ